MIMRRCTHCEAEIEIVDEARASCPICGLDPDLPALDFEDGPAFFFTRQPEAVSVPASP